MDEEKIISQDEEKQPTHISYKDYQKKVTRKSNDGIAIFVSAFFILLLLFLGVAKQISPEVDVSIGDNESLISESVGVEKSEVDERLKLLQMEDEGKNSMFADELEEKVVIPKDKTESDIVEKIKEELPEKVVGSKVEKEANPKPEETSSPAPKITVVQPKPEEKTAVQSSAQQTTPALSSTKVVVGYYKTKEQAEVAKEIIAESGLNISPFVRSIGGAYTIQVGSYSSREKAQSVMNELLRNNYPARLITE